jgi:hypothetical protein
MSRKISIQEKKKWLEMFEEGKTENQIALHEGKDLRTIVNGLQEASRQRHLANAEAEMLRTALLSHQEKLMGIVKGMASMLVIPDAALTLREDENGIMVATPIPGCLIEQNADKKITLKIHDEEKLEWELLQSHLKSDKLWKQLDKWQDELTTHIKARWVFKISIKNNLEAETGLKFKGVNDRQTEYLLPAIRELFYEVSMRKILGIKDGTDLEHTITAEKDGIVKHVGNNLAVCKKTTICRDKIIDVLTYLPQKTAAQEVKKTYVELESITKVARRQVDEIMSLGMIMGKCRVCARLGR